MNARSYGVALTALLALALAGCGGSGHKSSTASQPGAPASLGAPNTIAGQHKSQFAGRTGKLRFQALANTICQTVRTGAPAALHTPVQAPELRKYAASAAKANKRTMISLERLGAPSSVRSSLARLVGALKKLEGAYSQVQSGKGGSAASVAQTLTAQETLASGDALASGLPACAPHSPAMSAVAVTPAAGQPVRAKAHALSPARRATAKR